MKIKYFVIGLISGMVGVPLLQDISSLFSALIQALISIPSKITVKANTEIVKMQGDYDQNNEVGNVIGFEIPSQSEDFYDDESY